MTIKKKKSNHRLIPPLPKRITRYRKLNNTTGFAPSIFMEENFTSGSTTLDQNITIVNEQEWSSSHE